VQPPSRLGDCVVNQVLGVECEFLRIDLAVAPRSDAGAVLSANATRAMMAKNESSAICFVGAPPTKSESTNETVARWGYPRCDGKRIAAVPVPSHWNTVGFAIRSKPQLDSFGVDKCPDPGGLVPLMLTERVACAARHAAV
jgi:hypothetical protein